MNTTVIGTRMRVCTAAVLGLALAACENTESPSELQLTEPVEAEAEGTLDQAALGLVSMEQNMDSAVQRERDRVRARDGVDRRRDGRPFPDRVGIVIEFAESAVSLAERILSEQGATPPQVELLEAAEAFLRKAQAALEEGDPARAVGFAEKACWTALKAVVLPGGVSLEEARMIHDLAKDLLEAAWAEIGGAGDSIESVVFGWAVQFFEVGSNQLESGEVRGVAPLWKSAILAAWILG